MSFLSVPMALCSYYRTTERDIGHQLKMVLSVPNKNVEIHSEYTSPPVVACMPSLSLSSYRSSLPRSAYHLHAAPSNVLPDHHHLLLQHLGGGLRHVSAVQLLSQVGAAVELPKDSSPEGD